MSKERIGIMGGSFNPIHERHIQIAECALREGNLSRVLFVPTGNPPHKHDGLASAEHRFEMTRLAVLPAPGFTASRIELDREGVIYTVDTLTLLHKQFPAASFFYIIGEDTLHDLPNWRDPDKVFTLCTFLVCRRTTLDPARDPLCRELSARGARFQFLSLPPVDISSTGLRKALAEGESPAELAPQVMEYIHLMGLYGVPASPAQGREIYVKLRQSLSDKRLVHSLLVAWAARDLAKAHHVSESAAALAGLLHDCAKCLSLSRLQSIARQADLPLDKAALESGNLLHGPVGAVVAQREYGVTDPAVLSAISCHTLGKVGMLPLDMVLFLSDKIEPSRRTYPTLEKVRQLAKTDLCAAMRCSLSSTLDYVASQRITPDPTTRQVAQWLAGLESQENQRSETHE